MAPNPYYEPKPEDGAYQLRYSWTGWPSGAEFQEQPIELIDECKPSWACDGLRVLEYRWTAELVQILFSCTPEVSPEFITARAKGRIDHALRVLRIAMPFSRKVALRSIGENSRRDVETYIENQVGRRHFADPKFSAEIEALCIVDDNVDLGKPSESARGRYWYNLHLVLIAAGHAPIQDLETIRQIRNAFVQIAAKKGHLVSRLSVLPDHLHAALCGNTNESPLEIVYAYQNNLAHMTRRPRLWSPGFYVGTFGEYAMQAIRNLGHGEN